MHHQLVIDIIHHLCRIKDVTDVPKISERFMELVLCIIEHCGFQLRKDDPIGFKSLINQLSQMKTAIVMKESTTLQNSSKGLSRVNHLITLLTEVGASGRLQRTLSIHQETVKELRKWLGTMKNSIQSNKVSTSRHGQIVGDSCLRVSLSDIVDADKRGRWWRPGASWKKDSFSSSSHQEQQEKCEVESNTDRCDEENVLKKRKLCDKSSSEEKMLLKLAKKLKLNTETRRNILLVIMSSRDVSDAFERLLRLDLKGREDREIVRVLIECCAQETTFNRFYAELNVLLCNHNRQFKTTTLFAFWDFLQTIENDDSSDAQQGRIVNLVSEYH
jgi:nucleolar MIF4G domain-containing protein 1